MRLIVKAIFIAGQMLALVLNLCVLPALRPLLAEADTCGCSDDETAGKCCCQGDEPRNLADVLLRPANCRDTSPGTTVFVMKLDFVPVPAAKPTGKLDVVRVVECPASTPAVPLFEPPDPPPKFLVAV